MKARANGNDSTRPMPPARRPRIGLALGGGGARGLAHIPVLEAFDELGIRPDIISGTSIGAIFGAAYASGLSGRDIRAHTEEVLGQRFGLVRDIFSARAQAMGRFFGIFAQRSALLDAASLLDIIMPSRLAKDFADLAIPLRIVATDFYQQEPYVFTSGSVRRAVAASMALPVIFQPVVVDGRALIDGGLSNPLPFDLITGEADIVVAIDVSGAPVPSDRRDHPSALEALFASAFIFERTIVREKLKSVRPDIYIEGGTSHFQVLDFLRLDEILAAAAPAKDKLKAQLQRVLSSETIAAVEPPAPLAELEAPKRKGKGRKLLAGISKGARSRTEA